MENEVEQLIQNATSGFLNYHDKLLEEWIICGRSLNDWKKRYSIRVPKNPDIVKLKMLISEVSEYQQECIDILAGFTTGVSQWKIEEDAVISLEKDKLMEQDKKMSGTRADNLSRQKNIGLVVSRKIGEVLKDFFTAQLAKLKLIGQNLTGLQNLTMSELKAMPGAGIVWSKEDN